MVDVDVRLGLSGSDLAIRARTSATDLAKGLGSNVDRDTLPDVAELVRAGLGDAVVAVRRECGHDVAFVTRELLTTVLGWLRDNRGFAMLSDLFAIDRLSFGGDRYEVAYSLLDPSTARRLVVKVSVPEADAWVPTVSCVWQAASWPEREIYDMFGIHVEGHDDLRRILMPDDWIGHPLRKDYPLGGEEVEFSHNVRNQ